MRKIIILISVLLAIACITKSQTTIPAGEIKSTTWTKEGSPYLIKGKVKVPKLNTLTIESGVEIRLDGSFIVNGCLKAIGTNMNPIKFTRNKVKGYWGKIIIKKSNESVLNYCMIEYCKHLLIDNCSPQIDNITINNNDLGIFTKNSNSVLNYCKISNCQHQGILIKGSSLTIKNTLVFSCSHGICIKGASEVKVINSNILGNKGLGFDLDGIRAEINNCIIWGNKYAFKSYGRNRTVVSKCIVQKETSALGADKINKKLATSNIVGIPSSISDFENIILFNQQATMDINGNSIGILNNKIERRSITTSNMSLQVDNKDKEIGLSDVDINIPSNPQTNDRKFVVIIANENYSREVNVEYALNDGKIFKEYCEKTLGIPSKNIHFSQDATYGTIKSELNWISNVAEAYKGEAKLIFYYAGHGMPNESDKTAYLLPSDGISSDYETAISLKELYRKLGKYPTQNVTVLLDACFSGSARSDGMLANARGVRIKPKEEELKGNMFVLSAATSDETAYPYKEKQHGLFTYFLLKKLQETNGDADLKTLSNYITDNVKKHSIVINNKSQTPQIKVSSNLKDTWENKQF